MTAFSKRMPPPRPTVEDPNIEIINGLWDVFAEIVDDGTTITEDLVYRNFGRLPDGVLATGRAWGWSDIVFRDDAYEWFRDHGVE